MKTFLIDAICGAGFPNYALVDEYTRAGFATFTGNQHNESWAWNREALSALEEYRLMFIYTNLREARVSHETCDF